MKTIYIDCDGVILDSDKRLSEMKAKAGFGQHTKEAYYQYFNYAEDHLEEWDYILKEADQINNSVDIIKELENLKKRIVILTKIHSLHEMKIKFEVLRNKWNITSDIVFVPPYSSKASVVNPENNILIDDLIENIISWNEAGGEGVLFDYNLDIDTPNKIRSLKSLLEYKN